MNPEVLIKLIPDYPWVIVFIILFPTILTLVSMLLHWFSDWRKQGNKDNLTRDQQRQKDLDSQQKTLGGEQSRWFAELRLEREWLAKELEETRTEKEETYASLVRWYSIAHEVGRAYSSVRHDFVNLVTWLRNYVGVKYPDMEIPKFDVPDPIKLPTTLKEQPDDKRPDSNPTSPVS